jgi:hypothetical protein
MLHSAEHLTPAGRHLLDRRRFLTSSTTALGSIALTRLLAADGLLIDPERPYAPRKSHFEPKAKNVVVIFCAGAVSQLETWDYNPELIKWDDKPLPGGPAGFGVLPTQLAFFYSHSQPSLILPSIMRSQFLRRGT